MPSLPNLQTLHCELEEDDPLCDFDAPIPFRSLEDLTLITSTANPNLFSEIAKIKTLKKLQLVLLDDANVAFTGDGFENLNELHTLNVVGITDEAIQNIGKAKNLEALEIRGKNLSIESLKFIASLPHLKYFWPVDCGWTSKQLATFFTCDDHARYRPIKSDTQ